MGTLCSDLQVFDVSCEVKTISEYFLKDCSLILYSSYLHPIPLSRHRNHGEIDGKIKKRIPIKGSECSRMGFW